MKNKLLIAIALSFVLLSSVAWSQQKPQWEYKFEYKMNEKKANDLGAQGWELSAIESTSTAGLGTNVPTYVFKRQK